MDDEIITTSDDETRKYLTCWKGKALTDDAWIDPDVVERYKSISTLDSKGQVFFHRGE